MSFDTFLADLQPQRCWILEVDALSLEPAGDGSEPSGAFSDAAFSEVAFSEGSEVDPAAAPTLRYSSHGYTSKSTDTPASTWHDNRLRGDVSVTRRIFHDAGVGGLAATTGEVTLVNNDGELDDLQSTYALDGRPARLLLGDPSGARADFGLIFSCVVARFDNSDQRTVRFALSDGIAKLGAPVNANTYAGTGGLAGGSDLAGKPKPLAWGSVRNVPAPLVDSVKLIYQVHDGLINDVTAVYDRGVALTKGSDYASQSELETVAPAAGQFRVWKAGGFFRLNAAPAGTVTADALGDASGGYVNKTADIVQRALLRAGVDSSLVHASSFAQLNIDAPAEVGIWLGAEQRTVLEVVERLLTGIGAFGGFSRDNLFTVGVVKAASGGAVDSFDASEIGEGFRRLPLPGAVEPVVWRARVAWAPNYTVQTDIAAGASAAQRAFAAEAERVAQREDLIIRSQRQLAREYGPVANLYAQQADADTEAQRLLDLWKSARGLFLVPVKTARALKRELGDVVTITHPRYGFAAGRDVRILGVDIVGTKANLTVLA